MTLTQRLRAADRKMSKSDVLEENSREFKGTYYLPGTKEKNQETEAHEDSLPGPL